MAISLEELLELPADPLYYFCYPLLPKGGRMVIGAQPKSFKSMLALNIAYDLAEGSDVLGIWPVKQPLTVLVIEQEIGPYRLKDRLANIDKARRGSLAYQNLYVVSKNAEICLDSEEGLRQICTHIEQCHPDVLVLDPLRKFHSQDEDSSTDMVKVFRKLDALQEKYNLTTLIVHHAGKRSESRDATSPEALRGSSEIFADGDTFLMIEQPIKNDVTVLRLHFRLRSAADPHPLVVKFDENTFLFNKRDLCA